MRWVGRGRCTIAPLLWKPAEHVFRRPGCLEPAFSEASALILQIVECLPGCRLSLCFLGKEVGSQALEMGSDLLEVLISEAGHCFP